MNILVTGGAGYIGSHTLIELLAQGHQAVVLDNFCNASAESLRRVERISGQSIPLIKGDIRDSALLDRVFSEHRFDAVLHFAGLKAVGESVQLPGKYYENNVQGSLTLFQAMARASVFQLVFSSSATVYGEPDEVPVSERCPTGQPASPYGTSKLMVEQILADMAKAEPRWRIGVLRYFNPVGAHESGLIGEDPNDIPNNLVPYISQVAIGKLSKLSIFGNDYDTADGTGVRDYIHVVDLALGHLACLAALQSLAGWHVWNLGTGKGYSVLDMVKAFEQASGRALAYEFAARRPGDIACCYAQPDKARAELGWQAERDLGQMMQDTWRWQSQNPEGYR